MSYLFNSYATNKNWGWLFAWGIILIILGIIAVSLASLTTLISVIFIGSLIFAAGVVMVFDSFKSWWGRWGGFFLHLLIGVLYLIVGGMLIENPIAGSISLTLLLGVFYLVLGLLRLAYSVTLQFTYWGLSFLNGLVSLILGFLILFNWPASSLFIIGLFIGIDLIFSGWTYVMISLASRKRL